MEAVRKLKKNVEFNDISRRAYLNIARGKIEKGTNINTIDVPDIMREKIRTGIDWFDHAADHDNPGLTPSTVCLFTANPGCGKSTLARQLANSCTKQGHIALYNAGEESVFQVKLTSERLGLSEGFIIGCDTKIDVVFEHARKLKAQHPNKHLYLFLDSLQTLDDGFYRDGTINSATGVRVMKKVVEFCKETFAIAIAIGQVTKKGQFAGKQQMKHVIDAHCHMTFVNGSPQRRFKFTKNRFAAIPVKGTILTMTNGGLELVEDDADISIDEDNEE